MRVIAGVLATLILTGGQAASGPSPGFGSSADPVGDALVDIGGRRLHVVCMGVGSPTVILETGLNSSSRTWRIVQPAVAQVTRTCSYDRAGLGASDADPRTRTARRTTRTIIAELESLLRAAAISGPYVMVGHSLGGAHVRLFATQHSRDVVGMVLVDSSHEDQASRLSASGYVPPAEPDLPAEQDPDRTDMLASLKEVGAVPWHANIPLVVLSHGRNIVADAPGITAAQAARVEDIWRELQGELASRSSQGRLVVAQRSGHFVQSDEPQLVVDAIRDVVSAARSLQIRP